MHRVQLLPGRPKAPTLVERLARWKRAPRRERRATTDVSEVVCVVLGGGRGNRLFPLTLGRAKPAVPVGGRYRLVDIALSNALNSGIERVFLLTQFNSASLNSHVATTYRFDGFDRKFVEILAAQQTETSNDWYQGTADAVRKQLDRIRATRAREVVVLSGDHLYHMDLRELLARHREASADVTVAVTPVPRRDAPQLGLLRVDGDDMIREFAEKPKDPSVVDRFALGGDECLASMGIYVFNTTALAALLADETRTDFGHHVIPASIGTRPVAAYRFSGYWEDLGTIASYHRASLRLAEDDGRYSFFLPDLPVYSRPSILPASRVEGARLRATILAEGCRIEEDASLDRCVLGPRTLVGRGSRLVDSIVLGASRFEAPGSPIPRLGIGRGCSFKGVILDRDVRVGDGVVLENRGRVQNLDGAPIYVRDGIIVVARGTTIPSGFVF